MAAPPYELKYLNEPLPMLSRRTFLKSALIGGTAASIGLSVYDLQTDGYTADFILENVEVPIEGLPSAFSGYRIGFITDIHIGTWVPEMWLERALHAVKKMDVDLLLLGGDYILVHENSLWDSAGLIRNPRFSGITKSDVIPLIYTSFAECVREFTCRDGVLAVVGNHDHWNGFPQFLDILSNHPTIKLLINEEHSIIRGDQQLHIFGVDDYLTGLPSTPPQRQLANHVSKRIILSHNPDYIPAILERPEIDFSLALCGHTHGGQIVVPALGPIAAQVVDPRFISGMCRIGDRHIYTSRGLGVVGLPFRINCPAEVTVLTLVQG